MDNLQIMKNFNWSMLTFDILAATCNSYDNKWADNGRRRIADDFDRLYLVESGDAFVRPENGKTVHLVPGWLYLFPGGTKARYYRCPKSMRLAWTHFRIEAIPGLSLFLNYDPPSCVKSKKEDPELFHLLIESKGTNSPRSSVQASGILAELVYRFLPDSWKRIFPFSDRIEQLRPSLLAIHQNLNSPFDLKKPAKAVSLHPTYFSNTFKKTFKITPFQYHRKLLMRKAVAMLKEDSNSVSEVAYACGYSDPLYFSRSFRSYFGTSPSSYKKGKDKLIP